MSDALSRARETGRMLQQRAEEYPLRGDVETCALIFGIVADLEEHFAAPSTASAPDVSPGNHE